ncbi:MAG: hypothetical protein QOH90_1090, partial [Actinomycetota bacterium]|nr:hypothetical protein [Actinomycetota bacterium]
MQATPQTRPRLVRRTNDKMIAGVASGIADHFGWDPSLVRLGFLASLVLGGSGLFIYLIAAIVLPEEGETESPRWRERLRHAPPWLLAIGAAIVAIGILSDGGISSPGPFIALGLFGLGAMLLHEPAPRGPKTPAAAPPVTEDALPVAGSETTTTARIARPRREPSSLGLYTVGASFLFAAAAWAADRVDLVDMDPGRYLALVLLVFGGGLVVGAFLGRARALIPLGILLLPVVAVAGIINVPLR